MNRRTGVVAAHSLDHVDFEVPDLDEAKNFYETFGLDVSKSGDVLEVRTHGNDRPWARLHRGNSKKLRYVSFGIYEDDLPVFVERIASLGLKQIAPLTTTNANAIWIQDPHGVVVEIAVAPKRTLDKAHPRSSDARLDRGAPLRSKTSAVRPRRMSHALLFTPDIAASQKFYIDTLGLRLSDDAGAVAFLHAPHGSDHHVIAFAQSKGSGLHHLSWAVDSLEDVGLGAMKMAESGFTRGWGVGRHVLGSNYFFYVRDPWGSYSEYSYDIDYVPVDLDWPSSRQSPEDGFYLWGPPPPDDFVTNFEIDQTR